MLNNCPAAVRLGRHTWHQNAILYTMCHYLSEFEKAVVKLYADLIGFKSPTELFKNPTELLNYFINKIEIRNCQILVY